MPEIPKDVAAQRDKLLTELSRRRAQAQMLDQFYDGTNPFPQAVVDAKLTKLYDRLMSMAGTPWGSLVVDSVQDRLQPIGIRSGDDEVDEEIWGLWQENQLDSESNLAHNAALVAGRAFALIWPGEDGEVEITYDSAEQMIVQYREGSRRHRVAALRQWVDAAGLAHCILYRKDKLYKFRATTSDHRTQVTVDQWESWQEDDDEAWPLENAYNVVPVVEIPVNQRLKPGEFGFARGEYEHVLGLLNRINLLTFLGLVVAIWQGFPIRGIIGDKIMEDDDGNTIPPFEAKPNTVVQLEDPGAKTFEFSAADRKNLSVFAELEELAKITKTPSHYFPFEGGFSNIAEPGIRAFEGALAAKVTGHKGTLGGGHEETLRVGGLMLEPPVKLPRKAKLDWADHESRSLAERASAASQLKDVLPPLAVAEVALNASAEQIGRWQALGSQNAIADLLAAAARDGRPAAE